MLNSTSRATTDSCRVSTFQPAEGHTDQASRAVPWHWTTTTPPSPLYVPDGADDGVGEGLDAGEVRLELGVARTVGDRVDEASGAAGEVVGGGGSTTSTGVPDVPTVRSAESTANEAPTATATTMSDQARTAVTVRRTRTSTPWVAPGSPSEL